jgi:periplasmic protein TonB
MKVNDILYCSFEDILFENRNKSYGAYELRKSEISRMLIALLSAVIFYLSMVSIPILAESIYGKPIDRKKDVVILDFDNTKNIGAPLTNPKDEAPLKTFTPLDLKDKIYIFKVTPSDNDSGKTVSDEPVSKVDSTINSNSTEGSDQEIRGSSEGTEDGIGSNIGAGIGTGTPFHEDIIEKEEVVLDRADFMPTFGSGEKELLEYLAKNIKYPEIALKNGISGTVVIQFIVNKSGQIIDPIVLRGIGGGCEDEAIRVIKKMPSWTPGKQKGKPVSVRFTLPVRFSIL